MTEKEREAIFSNPQAFRQQVRMASVQVASISPGELSFALAYEVEPFSKIPAADADVAWREVPSDDYAFKVYDVAVVSRGRSGHAGSASAGGPAERIVRPALVAACLVLAAIAVDWQLTERRLSSARRETSVRRELDAQVGSVNSAARAKRTEADAVRRGREEAARAQGEVDALRRAYLDVMDAVAGVCGGATVVREFKSADAPFAFRIAAVAPSAESAADVMARLEDVVASKGWRLSSGAISSRAGGRTTDFDCRLEYSGEGRSE